MNLDNQKKTFYKSAKLDIDALWLVVESLIRETVKNHKHYPKKESTKKAYINRCTDCDAILSIIKKS